MNTAALVQTALLYAWLSGALYFVWWLSRWTANFVQALADFADVFRDVVREMTGQLRSMLRMMEDMAPEPNPLMDDND